MSPSGTAKMCLMQRFMCLTLATSHSIPRQTKSQGSCANSCQDTSWRNDHLPVSDTELTTECERMRMQPFVRPQREEQWQTVHGKFNITKRRPGQAQTRQ